MEIDYIKYKLPEKNYITNESVKSQIILGNSFNNNMRHYYGWLYRHNGSFKKTAAFTVDSTGIIHQHFEPKYQSKYFNNDKLDAKSIVILIENDGWLLKDNEKDRFITSIGYIYRKQDEIVEKKWRGYNYWSLYNEKQFESSVELIDKLCYEFNISKTSINHNTKIDGVNNFTGVLYKGNLEKYYTDLNPNWWFEELKNKIEQK